MRKIKLIFYPIYLLTILLVIAISLNIIESIQYLQKIGMVRYISDLPYLGRNLLLFLAGLMIIEFVIQNIHVSKLRRLSK